MCFLPLSLAVLSPLPFWHNVIFLTNFSFPTGTLCTFIHWFSVFFLFVKVSPSVQSSHMECENIMNSLDISLPFCFNRSPVKYRHKQYFFQRIRSLWGLIPFIVMQLIFSEIRVWRKKSRIASHCLRWIPVCIASRTLYDLWFLFVFTPRILQCKHFFVKAPIKLEVGNFGAIGNLNEVKPKERVVKFSWVKFEWEEVKCRKV